MALFFVARLYIYSDFGVVVIKLRSTRGSNCSSSAERSEARELQLLPQVLSNLITTTPKSEYLYYYYFSLIAITALRNSYY